MSEKITKTWLKKQEKAFMADRANRVAMDAVTSVGVMESAKRPDAFRTDLHAYSVSLPQTGITNQKHSGRCWMFAALNTMRFRIVKKLNLKDFELSQTYTMFWDKLEKANYFLESILETLDEPTSGRLIQWLLMAPVQDGGPWDMLCSLIDNYGETLVNAIGLIIGGDFASFAPKAQTSLTSKASDFIRASAGFILHSSRI